jgi:hypothetical protein
LLNWLTSNGRPWVSGNVIVISSDHNCWITCSNACMDACWMAQELDGLVYHIS